MAKRIEFKPAPKALNDSQGARERNEQRLREAPVNHADAVLALYELLQQMHDAGALDMLRGGLSAGGKLVEEVSTALVQPEAIRGIRNFILLGKIMASIHPEMLERVVMALPPAEQQQFSEEKPPSIFSLLRRMVSADSRRGIAIGLSAAAALGQATRPPRPKP